MFEQFIGWMSAAVIAWIFAEAILYEKGTCVAMVVRRSRTAALSRTRAIAQREDVELLHRLFEPRKIS
jgi:hypothetical protein